MTAKLTNQPDITFYIKYENDFNVMSLGLKCIVSNLMTG